MNSEDNRIDSHLSKINIRRTSAFDAKIAGESNFFSFEIAHMNKAVFGGKVFLPS